VPWVLRNGSPSAGGATAGRAARCHFAAEADARARPVREERMGTGPAKAAKRTPRRDRRRTTLRARGAILSRPSVTGAPHQPLARGGRPQLETQPADFGVAGVSGAERASRISHVADGARLASACAQGVPHDEVRFAPHRDRPVCLAVGLSHRARRARPRLLCPPSVGLWWIPARQRHLLQRLQLRFGPLLRPVVVHLHHLDRLQYDAGLPRRLSV
jgi:hypothetical protein